MTTICNWFWFILSIHQMSCLGFPFWDFWSFLAPLSFLLTAVTVRDLYNWPANDRLTYSGLLRPHRYTVEHRGCWNTHLYWSHTTIRCIQPHMHKQTYSIEAHSRIHRLDMCWCNIHWCQFHNWCQLYLKIMKIQFRESRQNQST